TRRRCWRWRACSNRRCPGRAGGRRSRGSTKGCALNHILSENQTSVVSVFGREISGKDSSCSAEPIAKYSNSFLELQIATLLISNPSADSFLITHHAPLRWSASLAISGRKHTLKFCRDRIDG